MSLRRDVLADRRQGRDDVLYGGLLASKDKITNYLHIILQLCAKTNKQTKTTLFGLDLQLTAYLRQKHTISNYLNRISSYVIQ